MILKKTSLIKRASAFSHADEHLRVKTVHGAIVTLLGALLAATLFVSEVRRCLAVRVEQSMAVDLSRADLFRITLDITFPALPCQALRLDTGDISGKYETESMMKSVHDGEIHKYQLSSSGHRLHVAEYIAPAGNDNPFVLTLDAGDMEAVRAAVERHEGCQIQGWLDLRRVAGNVHIGVRPEAMLAVMGSESTLSALLHRHVELHGDAAHPDHAALNASHIITTLRFGESFPGQVQPLEGTRRIDRKATGLDKYFLSVVPTEYCSLWGHQIHTHQYSVTEYYSRIIPGSRMLPGLYLLYDTWPIAVTIRATSLGFLHLLARLCAVCGGVWAVTRAVDSVVHSVITATAHLVPAAAAA